ncbi:signal peptidase II [Microbacterium nymphoidis]|uniref:signal peptidase II n=1 Tax=Microbacterium nymphoidis TaxID=2898586 RepID=UPI0027E15F83|nr:signal peptidase II [Microbacterium nymphoidis]
MTVRKPLPRAAASAIIAIIAVVALAADQFTKHLVLQNLQEGVWVNVIGEFLRFTLTFNPGAAFSMGEGVTWIFSLALAGVAIAIIVLMFTRVKSRLWAVVLGALLGGVLGNLTDRLFRAPGFLVGHVVDFINTPWMMPAIYNVADMFIVTSMISIAIIVLVGVRMDGTREAKPDAAEASVQATGSGLVLGAIDDEDRYESRRERRDRLAAQSTSEGTTKMTENRREEAEAEALAEEQAAVAEELSDVDAQDADAADTATESAPGNPDTLPARHDA